MLGMLGAANASAFVRNDSLPDNVFDCGKEKIIITGIFESTEEILIRFRRSTIGKGFISITNPETVRPDEILAAISDLCIPDEDDDFGVAPSNTPRNDRAQIQEFPLGDVPVDVVGADFDGNGTLDLAFANQGSNDVSVILIDDQGVVGPTVQFPTGTTPSAIVAGDFDGDDQVDLATANASVGGGDVSLLLGDGDGGFGAPQSIPAGAQPVDLAVMDADGDDNLDLAVADSLGEALLLVGDGVGGFAAPAPLGVEFQVSILATHIDGDPLVDLVTDGWILLADGSGGFDDPLSFAAESNPTFVRDGDLDGDGKTDLITDDLSNRISVYLGNGDGTFADPTHYVTGATPAEILILDGAGTDEVDLVVSNFASDHLTVFENRGDGTFRGAESYVSAAPDRLDSQLSNEVAVADFDGDDLPDLAAANVFEGEETAVLPGLPGGRFEAPQILSGQEGAGVLSADFEGDQVPDLALVLRDGTSGPNDRIHIRRGNGDFSFEPPTTITLGDNDFPVDDTISIDVDGDGYPDLVSAETGTDTVSVFLGDGDGNFGSAVTTAVGDTPIQLASGDFDDDGVPDLAVVNAGPLGSLEGSLSILLGAGDGSFSAGPELFPDSAPDSAVVGDLDGDGADDLAAIVQAPVFEWKLWVVPGNGDGSFGVPMQVPVNAFPIEQLAAVDLDVDGDLDLLALLEGAEVGVFDNLGGFEFSPAFRFDGGEPHTITVADLNRDGGPDLVLPQLRGGKTAVLLNQRPPPFDALALSDVDGGGDGEAAVVRGREDYGQALVRDTATGDRVKTLRTTRDEPAVDAAVVADQNGNGSEDLAFLLLTGAEGRPRLELRDSLTGRRIRAASYNNRHLPLALAIAEDQSGNGSQEAVVLTRKLTGDKHARLLVRDLASAAKLGVVEIPPRFDPLDVVTGPDLTGNGRASAYVLSTRRADRRGFVNVYDTGGAGLVNIPLPAKHDVVAHAALLGINDRPAVAVLLRRQSDGLVRVFVYAAESGQKLWSRAVGRNRAPIDLTVFATATGAVRLAALTWREADHRPVVSLFKGKTGVFVHGIGYPRGRPLAVTVFPDVSTSANGAAELGVLYLNRLQLRDSVDRSLVSDVSFP